ncbi:MAG TPA: diaminopimelate decarboxylase [Chitinophaga sp.]|nr:diaminopimelate decarboxylase [Chitinophaga sp.]
MDLFQYKNAVLHCEDVSIENLAEKGIPTPFYLYSLNTLKTHYKKVYNAFGPLQPIICFSVKSCNNVHLLNELAALGSGMDIVSGGELFMVKSSNTDLSKVVFAGVGKSEEEITDAINSGVGYINIESIQELQRVQLIAGNLKRETNVLIRILPDILDEKTNEKTRTGYKGAKFGIDYAEVKSLIRDNHDHPYVNIRGLHCHIGSPISSYTFYEECINKMVQLVEELKAENIFLKVLNIGGGFPANYTDNDNFSWESFAGPINRLLEPYVKNEGFKIILEPGRSISANTGILVTKVLYIKQSGDKNIVIVDAGMTNLIRPAMYGAFHYIWPVHPDAAHALAKRNYPVEQEGLVKYDVVGPICESSDYLAKDRELPPLHQGDYVAIFTTGAYGMVMASNYNLQVKPAELMVDGDKVYRIRERETQDDLIRKMVKSEL